jgi:hypothetical protein
MITGNSYNWGGLFDSEKYKEAGEMFKKAVAIAPNEKGSHESTYSQAKRLAEKLKPTEEEKDIGFRSIYLPG